jgi:hypothetical protein
VKKLALVVLFGATIACTAHAAKDTCKIFLWDNDAGETAQEAPAAAMDKNYNSCYVWADKRDGDWNIYGRLWGRKPEALSKSFMVNQEDKVLRDQKAPDVAGKTGEFVFVVWQDSISKEPYWQIYGRKMRPSGEPMSDDIRINRVVARNAKFPKIAINPTTQEFAVVWQDDRNGDWDIYARVFDSDGKPLTDDVKICEDPDKKHQVLPIICASEKSYEIAWQDYRTNRSSIYMRHMKPDLNPYASETIVSNNIEVAHLTPAIAASDTGFFTIAWINLTGNPVGNIFAQRFDPDAKPIDKNFQVNLTPSGYPCRIPSITMGIDNVSFWVSWADSTSADRYQIKARYFDNYARWESVKLVNQNPANGQRAPSVCRFGEYFSVAWLDSSRTGGLGDIFGQYYTNAIKAEQDTLKAVGINYSISSDPSAGRKIWYHPKKNYDDPSTPGWNEDPIAEPDSIYIPLDSAYVRAFNERNIPNQMFVQITDTDILEYAWRKQGKLNSSDAYDMCLLDLGYAEDGSSAGVIQVEQLDSLEDFALDTNKCLLVTGNDFGEMYNTTTLFSYFGSKYIGPGNSSETGNIQKINGLAGTFTEGMLFDYPFQQGPDNSVDIVGPMATGSQLIMESEGPGKITYGRATTYGSYYKGGKASNHNNVYLTFSIGSLSNGIHPSTASELTRRILAYQGFNVEPEPIVDLVDSVYTGEGYVQLSWTAVSDDALTEKATKYWLKYTKYVASASDLGKMSSEKDFIDTGATYYQAWIPLTPTTLEKKYVGGLPPGDTLIFALKAGDESSPTRWSTLGNEPRIVVGGDTVTPHTVRLGYTYGAVNDFIKSERIGIRGGDTLFTTWDATNLYLGYSRCDWRTAGDLVFYFDTRSGGADSTFKYNGTGSAGFDVNFRPDFCLVFENADSISLKKWNGSAWVDSVTIAAYLAANRPYLDSINKFTYAEMQVPFSYLKYTVGNVFKFLAVSQYETSDNPWNAFPTTNSITTKGAKVPAKYGSYYQFNSLASGVSPRAIATPMAVELSMFAAAFEQGSVNLAWQSGLEEEHNLWLVERSSDDGKIYTRLAELKGTGSGSDYSYQDNSALPGQDYLYRLGALDNLGATEWYGPVLVNIPEAADIYSYSLRAMPNPFNNSCQIRYSTSRQERMALKVYDICGHLVKTLFDEVKQPGSYAANWTGTDDNGRNLSNGVYFYRLTSGQGCLTQKITLLR